MREQFTVQGRGVGAGSGASARIGASGREHAAVERDQLDQRGADSRAQILKGRANGCCIVARDRVEEAIVGRQTLRRLRQLAAVAVEHALENQSSDLELAVNLTLRIRLVCGRHRKQRRANYGRKQREKSNGNAGPQLHAPTPSRVRR